MKEWKVIAAHLANCEYEELSDRRAIVVIIVFTFMAVIAARAIITALIRGA